MNLPALIIMVVDEGDSEHSVQKSLASSEVLEVLQHLSYNEEEQIIVT